MLIKCGECGHDVSDKAVSCPNCGAPVIVEDKKEVKERPYYKTYMACPKCGFAVGGVPTHIYKCSICGCNELIDTEIEATEENKQKVVAFIQNNPNIDQQKYNANLKDRLIGNKNPLKMIRFVSKEQHEEDTKRFFKELEEKVEALKTAPHCPICNSTDLSKITTASKVGKIAMFGIFGMGDNGKTWKCNHCGSKF